MAIDFQGLTTDAIAYWAKAGVSERTIRKMLVKAAVAGFDHARKTSKPIIDEAIKQAIEAGEQLGRKAMHIELTRFGPN